MSNTQEMGHMWGAANGWRAAFAVVAAVVVGDLCLFGAEMGGLGLPVAALVVAALSLTTGPDPRHPIIRRGALGLFLSALPAVEAVKLASVLLLLVGCIWFAGCLVAAQGRLPAWAAALRFPVAASVQWLHDMIAGVERTVTLAQRRPTVPAAIDWVLPVGLGLVFLVLLQQGNPLLHPDLSGLFRAFDPDPLRLTFWFVLAMAFWPLMRSTAMAARVRPGPLALLQSGLGLAAPILTDRSVRRALVLFNLIFAVQSLSDLTYLWGGVALPQGMTYAAYAHRGAYPLVATALLAGAFAVIAQPHLRGQAMRGLLVLWVLQNLLLVASSGLRLDLYVQSYGLTHLRVAAVVWMTLTGAGLLLMLWQIIRHLPVVWMLSRAGALGLVTIWLISFVNIDGLIARTNLGSEGRAKDMFYLCNLGPGAIPALTDWQAATGRDPCPSLGGPLLHPPADWREWGFRNARILSSLQLQPGVRE
jgi:hypothetical protein